MRLNFSQEKAIRDSPIGDSRVGLNKRAREHHGGLYLGEVGAKCYYSTRSSRKNSRETAATARYAQSYSLIFQPVYRITGSLEQWRRLYQRTEAPTQITEPSPDRMVDKPLSRRKGIPSSATHGETDKGITKRFEKANFEIKKLEIDKEHVERRIEKPCQGRDKLEEILERTRAREQESQLKGWETRMQKSANLARSYERGIRKHDNEINAREDMLENLDGEQKKWDLELERLRGWQRRSGRNEQ
jgi:hypothetical protein